MKKPDLPTEDIELFRREAGEVRPLKAKPRVSDRGTPPPPHPQQRQRDEAAVLSELLDDPGPEEGLETGEELLFLRPGFQKRYLTRLRRGQYAVADHLDLHGLNEASAAQLLHAFIDRAAGRGPACVRVVHGKGLRSRRGPRLKMLAARLLRRHKSVVAYASCRPADGGTGAVLVLLRAT